VLADVEVVWPRAGTVEERTQRYRAVPLDRRIELTEDPREITWLPDPEHAVVVPDATTTEIHCAGAGDPDPLTTIDVEAGPEWVRTGPWRGGRTVVVDPPRVDRVTDEEATLVAVAQGAEYAPARQSLRVRVVPAPVIAKARRDGARRVRVDGDHLDVGGLVVTVDGIRCEVRSAKALRPKQSVPRSRLVVAVPKELRAALRSGAHVVRVIEPVGGFDASSALSR
jgi:hypothetical protein